MKILLVEDDAEQATIIEQGLKEEFGDGCSVTRLATENAFREAFENIAEDSYDLIVMDMMLRWCDLSEKMPEPPLDWEDFSRAGVRCSEMLKADARTRSIPIVVLTVLDNHKNGLGLPQGCEHVPKTSDFARSVSEKFRQFKQ